MKLRLQVHVNREDKQIVVSIVCNHCTQEAAANVLDDVATFSCPTHGKLGSASVAEVSAILNRARNEAERKEGWGRSDFSTIVAHRVDEKAS
jgi:hypothetical protein